MTEARRLELERYLDGELPPDERTRVIRQLVTDLEARNYLDRLRDVRELTQRAFEPDVSEPHPALMFVAPESRPPRWRLPAAAAIVAASAFLAWEFRETWFPATATRPPSAPPASPAAERPADTLYASFDQERPAVDSTAPSKAKIVQSLMDSPPTTRERDTNKEMLALQLANDSEQENKLAGIAMMRRYQESRSAPPPSGASDGR